MWSISCDKSWKQGWIISIDDFCGQVVFIVLLYRRSQVNVKTTFSVLSLVWACVVSTSHKCFRYFYWDHRNILCNIHKIHETDLISHVWQLHWCCWSPWVTIISSRQVTRLVVRFQLFKIHILKKRDVVVTQTTLLLLEPTQLNVTSIESCEINTWVTRRDRWRQNILWEIQRIYFIDIHLILNSR